MPRLATLMNVYLNSQAATTDDMFDHASRGRAARGLRRARYRANYSSRQPQLMATLLICKPHPRDELVDLWFRQELREHISKHVFGVLLIKDNPELVYFLLYPKENCIYMLCFAKTSS
jgi:hypothetical protein